MKLKLAIITVFAAVAALAGYGAVNSGVPGLAGNTAYAADANDATGTYTIDPNHSSIYFDITHLGLALVNGRFNKFTGKVVANAQDVSKSSVTFTAEASSIDTGIEARDNHLRTPDFFDAAQFPDVSFASTSVRAGRDSYVLSGNLTMHGVTKPVEIEFRLRGPYTMAGKDGKSTTKIGIIAEPLVIKRSDFGIGKTDPMPDGTLGLSDEVTVRISFEANQDEPAAN